MRILQRRGDLVEFAYLLVAVLHSIAMHVSQDVVCDIVDSKHIFCNSCTDFKNEADLSDQSKVPELLDNYLFSFLQESIKAPQSEPI